MYHSPPQMTFVCCPDLDLCFSSVSLGEGWDSNLKWTVTSKNTYIQFISTISFRAVLLGNLESIIK